jgi:hypothetical protein
MSPAVLARWQQLESFAFDAPDAVFTFEDKLIRETGWTRAFAQRAIAEYRRFLLLAAEAGHAVSPSPAVDHVWHLHLLCTRSYWDELCPKILGFDFHHEPATGAAGNRAKLDEAYARTLASYRAIFGEDPPPDLWPAQPQAIRSQRVDLARMVVLPRAAWRACLAALTVAAVAAAVGIVWLALSD